MNTKHMRMAALRLPTQELGSVYGFEIDDEFASRWRGLKERWKDRDEWRRKRKYVQLPYAALAHALCVLSGDFVTCQKYARGGQYLLLSRRPIDPGDIRRVFAAWELCLGEPEPGALSSLVGARRPVEISLAELVRHRPDASPVFEPGHGWVWDVVHWAVAHRLASQPLELEDEGRSLALRLDSDGRLLTWADLVGPEGHPDRAMHVISPKIITVPGIEEFVVHLRGRLVRLASSWGASRSSHAWAELAGQPTILRAAVAHRPPRDSEHWTTHWKDHTAELLARCALDSPPGIADGPEPSSSLRAGFCSAPRAAKIGRGVGIWFIEHLAHHARATIPDAAPLEMTQVPRTRRKMDELVRSTSLEDAPTPLRLVVVYHHTETRRRLRDGILEIFRELVDSTFAAALVKLDDGIILAHGPLELVFVRPPESTHLVDRDRGQDWSAWLDGWLSPLLGDARANAALVETNERASKDSEGDPKFILRARLAERGVVSQFITVTSTPRVTRRSSDPTDYAAQGAVRDALRSAGWFAKHFPAAEVETGAFAIGVYFVRAQSKRGDRRVRHFVNLVAVEIGQANALGYDPDEGWIPLHRATARFLAREHDLGWDDVPPLVEHAITQFRARFQDRPTILVFDAFGCRRHWPALSDAGAAQPLPSWMTGERMAVVRIRAEEQEVLRPAGTGDWSQREPARFTKHRLMRIDGLNEPGAAFLFSGSAIMDNCRTLRRSTRFACSDRALGDEWPALGTTEIQVLAPGPFNRGALEVQIALMCRIGPSWSGQLRWPSPLHLARAIVRDHPRCQLERKDDADLDDER